MQQNLSGTTIGKYELREQLGRGGMAEVYKAYHTDMDRFVAVKVMLSHLVSDEQFIERFRREARAVGKLRHPHIVNVFDFGTQDDMYYMVMEYIQGSSLKAHIRQQGQLPATEALKITAQLADALAYAHSQSMIHRDIKPANVMFMDKENTQSILTDFGIARILTETGLTMTGMAVGTPAYMSPEAGLGNDTDERSDLYALGVMLYEMLTGNAPYSADTPLAVIMKHVNAPLPSLADLEAEMPTVVERLVLKSMAKDPADRFQTAAEMKAAVDAALLELTTGAPTKHAASPPPEAPAPLPSGFNALTAGVLAIVGVVAVVAVVLLIVAFQGRNDSPAAAALPTQAIIEQATNPPPPPMNTSPPPTNPPAPANAPRLSTAAANRLGADSPLLDEIVEEVREGGWERAYEIAQRMSQRNLNAQQYADIAYVAYVNEEYEQAREWAEQAVALDNTTGSAYYVGGLMAWQAAQDQEMALRAFDRASDLRYTSVFISPENGHEVNLDRGRMLANFDAHRDAVRSYDMTLQQYPDWPEVYVEKARSLIALEQYGPANADLNRARSLTTDDDLIAEIDALLATLPDDLPSGP